MSISNISSMGVDDYNCIKSEKKTASIGSFAEKVQKAEESRSAAEKTASSAWAGDMIIPQPPVYSGFSYNSSISSKSREQMTMDEYKQWFMNEVSGMPVSGWYRSTCVGGALIITEACFERMKNDPEWEKTVLGMIRNMYSSSGLMGSKMIGYQVIGATPEQCYGEGIPVRDGVSVSKSSEESWWLKRHKRFEEWIEQLQEEAVKRAREKKAEAQREEAQETYLQSHMAGRRRQIRFFAERMQNERDGANAAAIPLAVTAYDKNISAFSRSAIKRRRV